LVLLFPLGWYVPKITSSNLGYIQDLVEGEKYLVIVSHFSVITNFQLESNSVKPVVVPKSLTLELITEFLPLFDPSQTYLDYIPSFLEDVDREYLIHVPTAPKKD
jgi:hypothetical protein